MIEAISKAFHKIRLKMVYVRLYQEEGERI